MSLFKAGQDPRHYFVELIRKRAQEEGIQFSEFEAEYLSRSAAGEDEYASKMLDGIKGKTFEEFDSRISGLLWRAYQQDVLQFPDAKQRYEEATNALAAGETYLNLGMFVTAIVVDTPPEKIDTPWPTIIILGALAFWLIYLVMRGLLKSG